VFCREYYLACLSHTIIHSCGPQKLDLRAVQGIPRLQSQSRMAYTALDISPRSRHNKSVELSLFRLNHWLPWSETHPEVVQGTAEFHHQMALLHKSTGSREGPVISAFI